MFIKAWHLLGTICVLVSFPFLFVPPIGLSVEECESPPMPDETAQDTTMTSTTDFTSECIPEDEQAVTGYYLAFGVLFQFGWAATQISHLSMIPGLTSSERKRNALTSIRYAATVGSSICVYCIIWILLHTGKL